MSSDSAVSELIGALLLVSLVIMAVMIVSVILLSQPPPEDIPQVTALADNQSKTVYLYHDGGDSLQPEEIKTIVNGEVSSFSLVGNETWPWSAGKTLKIDYTGPGMPQYVQLVYTGGTTQTLILTSYFVPPEIIGAPTTVVTSFPTTIPTTIPTTVPTTSPTTTPDSTPTTTNTTVPTTSPTTSPTPTPTPDCGTISGYKWNDLNGNGIWDAGEPGLSGWTIKAYECHTGNCNNPTFVGSEVTGTGGYYIFTGLTYQPSTRYKLEETLQTGWQQTFPSTGYHIVKIEPPGSPGQPEKCYETDINFGNRQIAPPVADFIGNPTSGNAPLTVQFTDQSTGSPTQWAWDVNNDGITDYTTQNPQHTYTSPGTYTVKLTVTNAGGSNTKIRTNYITVNAPSLFNIFLTADKSGALETGNYIQFRVIGLNSYIKHGNTIYDLNPNDIVKLEITNDQTGKIYATSTYISDFRFNNVRLYINGVDKGVKDIGNNDIWISWYDSYVSTLKLVVPAHMDWTHLSVNGIPVIYGFDNREISIYYLRTDTFGVMNLDCTGDVFYNGGSTVYPVF